MKWTSPQAVTAVAALILGFLLIYLDFFLSEEGQVHDSSLYVLGQSFLYAGAIFGVKGYVDGKFVKFKNEEKNETH